MLSSSTEGLLSWGPLDEDFPKLPRVRFRDILFGVLKRLMLSPTSKLKLVVTSATLEEHKFADFFGGCPVLKVPGRLHPVKVSGFEIFAPFSH